MIDRNRSSQTERYHVRVGHSSVTVECYSPDEAIALARRMLSLEMPRMWDVIQALAADRFEVSKARPQG
jgi:hypothetical protein